MKRFLAFLTALSAAICCCACGSGNDEESSSSASQTSQTEESQADSQDSQEEPLPEVESIKLDDENFAVYSSNTYVSTGNNGVIKKATNVTYRAYLPVEEYGELEYCFYFSNTVDSTYNKGKPVYVGKPGGEYTITSASIADGGTSIEDEISNVTAVTFDGSAEKEVAANETYWSDPVTIDIPEGHYLVWEWTITGSDIPCIQMSDLTSTASKKETDDDFVYNNTVPLPVYIGAKRDVSQRVTVIGDSITQGCQTEYMAFEFWAARIAQGLGQDVGFYNCGLGSAAASDCATMGNWLARAMNTDTDTVIVAFGTNDIVTGEYGGDGGNTAEEIAEYVSSIIAQLKASEIENIIVFNAPPFDYNEDLEAVRTEYNELLKTVTEKYGVEYFDFASYLSDESDPSAAKYGGHPNGEGGQIVADAVLEQYFGK